MKMVKSLYFDYNFIIFLVFIIIIFVSDQILFTCHCKRHDPFKEKDEINDKNQYELVQFFGYFRPSSEIFRGDKSGVLSPFNIEDDDQKYKN